MSSTENALLGFTLMHSIHAKASLKAALATDASKCQPICTVGVLVEEDAHGFE